jgi:small subunit ribosomal protein S8e
MGISRDSRHKRRLTGGRMPIHKKKRLFESGRPSANTKIGEKRIRRIRVRGGNYKFRALRLDAGNFSWGSESTTRKTRVLDVVYNASNNELVRTKTLVKNAVIQVDATPFRAWYSKKYGVELGKKKAGKEGEAPVKQSKHVKAVFAGRQKDRYIDPNVEEQFNQGRLLACISSRPGQSGRVDGYVLEGRELEFHLKKLDKKSKA